MNSPLATKAPHLQRGHGAMGSIRGLAVHTTGGGLLDAAHRASRDVFEHAVEYYTGAKFHPHYVLGWDGELAAVCDETRLAWHIGLLEGEASLLAGEGWRGKVVHHELWERAWHPHGIRHPSDLWPGSSPNRSYLGVEMIPLEVKARGRDGLWFSAAQHTRVAELAADILARHAIAPAPGVVAGHEDLNPLGRWDKGGGWDPGARRERPRFDWGRVLARLGLG